MCIRNSLGDVLSPGLGLLASAQTVTCIINLEQSSGTSLLLFLIVTSGFGGGARMAKGKRVAHSAIY